MPGEAPGWHSRGYLPHYDDGTTLQSITYRLFDALPAEVVARLKEQALGDELRQAELERQLDAGYGSCLLREPRNAAIVADGWRHFDGIRYHLHAWVVMPNHVHVLIAPLPGQTIAEVVQAEKSYTAKAILRGSAGVPPARRQVWQPDYHDRFIRHENHRAAVVDYIHQNPVKAGLVARPEDWPWSSAHGRERDRPARPS